MYADNPRSASQHLELSVIRQFGSLVRGESDLMSDRDLLVIVPGASVSEEVRSLIRSWTDDDYDVSVYTEGRYREMHGNGHLFAWHIFRESVALDTHLCPSKSGDVINTLGIPAAYQEGLNDSRALLELLHGIIESLGRNESSEIYEAGLLYVIARNWSIAACAQLGDHCFSVNAPYEIGARLGNPFPLDPQSYAKLRQSRKISQGRLSTTTPLNRARLVNCAHALKQWLDVTQHQEFGGSHV
jgi:hypothetical protein